MVDARIFETSEGKVHQAKLQVADELAKLYPSLDEMAEFSAEHSPKSAALARNTATAMRALESQLRSEVPADWFNQPDAKLGE